MHEPAPATILIVEDTEATRYAVGRILRKAGFAVREAGTAAEGLRQAAEGPDLILLDVQLPDGSGYEVCRRIKADPRTALIPVLQMSANFVESDSRSEGLESGADAYLTYPVQARELLASVRALLRVRQAEQAARHQSELLRVTLTSIADGVIATDTQGRVTFLNPVAEALTGWPEAEARGRPLAEVFATVRRQTGEPAEDSVSRAIRQAAAVCLTDDKTLIARDGSRRAVSDSAAPIRDEKGRVLGCVLVIHDVSEQRRMEDQLRQRAEELAALDRRKDEFLAMLAHELRNPLAPIRNAVQILRLSGGQGPAAGHARDVIERQLHNLARLVEDLLDVSRVSRGKIQLRKERVELAAVVRRALETTRPLIEERRHQTRVELPAAPVWLEGDPTRLEQVLTNLLNNAAKYTDPGGHIRLTARREGGEVVVSVRDTGMGMGPQVLPHVFDLFAQADRALDRSQGGLGIGLTLVKTLVGMHGGSVSATSPGPGLGSTFTVRLPALPEEAGGPGREPRGEVNVPTPARRYRILVVDDDADSAGTLATLLRLEGQETRVAGEGPEALAEADAFRPDVVLLDIGLPGMDGYQVAEALRQRDGGRGAVLVALTGFGQEEDRRRALEAGFDHHFVKPVDPGALQEFLNHLQGGKGNAAKRE